MATETNNNNNLIFYLLSTRLRRYNHTRQLILLIHTDFYLLPIFLYPSLYLLLLPDLTPPNPTPPWVNRGSSGTGTFRFTRSFGLNADDSCYAAYRQELLAWLNNLLQLNMTKIEQCGTGYERAPSPLTILVENPWPSQCIWRSFWVNNLLTVKSAEPRYVRFSTLFSVSAPFSGANSIGRKLTHCSHSGRAHVSSKVQR